MRLHSNLWMSNTQNGYFGKGRIELLKKISQRGSISKAAKDMHMSYKAAWAAVEEMNRLSDRPIVKRATGGKGGGGTVLTERGEEIIEIFGQIEKAQAGFFAMIEKYADDLEVLRAFTSHTPVRTSARNQITATVSDVQIDGNRAMVRCRLYDDISIVVQITRRSLQELGLEPGSSVAVLFKPAWIELYDAPPEPTPINLIHGVILEHADGEMHIAIHADMTLIAATDDVDKWNVGEEIWLCIEPQNMLLAV